ncbi:MAG: hypothetical protein HYY00_07800 [Chloroflexi bacterium]|nr:hypothetical protein [Chloroflexota bacterium]
MRRGGFAAAGRCLAAATAAGLSLVLALVVAARAQGPIEVLGASVTADFPNTITFRISARSQTEITRASLLYRVSRPQCARVVSVAQPEFRPSRTLNTQWEWQLRETGGLPVGASVLFHWAVRDAAGNVAETLEEEYVHRDPRFDWRQVQGDGVTLNWYRGDEAFARTLLDSAVQALERLNAATGASARGPLRAFIYGDTTALQAALVFPQEWTGGVAFTDFGIVAIAVPPSNLEWGQRAMVHEVTHLAVSDATFNCYVSIPAWLNEGLATYNEGPAQERYESVLRAAVAKDSLLTLRSIEGDFPSDPEKALLAYAQSRSVVAFLLDGYGPGAMQKLLAAFREGSPTDAALQAAYGFDEDGLERRWRQHLGLPVEASTPLGTPALPREPLPTLEPYQLATPPAGPTTPVLSTPSPQVIPSPGPTATPGGDLSCGASTAVGRGGVGLAPPALVGLVVALAWRGRRGRLL